MGTLWLYAWKFPISKPSNHYFYRCPHSFISNNVFPSPLPFPHSLVLWNCFHVLFYCYASLYLIYKQDYSAYVPFFLLLLHTEFSLCNVSFGTCREILEVRPLKRDAQAWMLRLTHWLASWLTLSAACLTSLDFLR